MPKAQLAHRHSPDATALMRRAPLNATSFDPKTNSFSAVISSGSAVKRRDPYDGTSYFEVLAISQASVRLDRAKAGVVPLLDSHQAGSLDDQIGVVTDVRIENGQLVADMRLSPNECGKAVAAAISAGAPPNVSIGYQVHAFEEDVASRNATPTLTATDWELLEVSLVPIPADPRTFIRNHKGINMPTNEVIEAEENQEITARADQDDRLRTMSDRQAREAYDITARANLPADFARQHIERGVTLNEFRTLIFDRLAGAADSNQTGLIRMNDQTFDNPSFLERSIEDVLYARMAGKPVEGAAREHAGRTILDLGAMLLQARGERVSWSNRTGIADQMMQRAGGLHTTSDFPVLLQNAGDRVLRDAYQAAETPLKVLARRRNAVDFRPMTSAQLSEAPRLLEVGEGDILNTDRGPNLKRLAQLRPMRASSRSRAPH
jgi:phage head maturation protease